MLGPHDTPGGLVAVAIDVHLGTAAPHRLGTTISPNRSSTAVLKQHDFQISMDGKGALGRQRVRAVTLIQRFASRPISTSI